MKLSEIRFLTQNLPDASYHVENANLMEHVRILGLDTTSFHQELEMDSPFVDTYRDITYSNAHVQLHSHVFYELLFCRNTCGAEYLVGSERYKLQKGDLIFVPPGISHRPILPEHMTEPYIRDVVWVNADFMDSMSKAGQATEGFPHTTLLRTAGSKWDFLGELFRVGVAETNNQALHWNNVVIGNTLSLLSYLSRAYLEAENAQMPAEKPELLEQVLAYIELHLHERITLAEVAHHFYISESTVTQTFRKRMGVSFYRYVTQRRLIAAKGLILNGLPMDSVGEQVGFKDYSSFFRAFKQEYGISPSQYKKSLSAQLDSGNSYNIP